MLCFRSCTPTCTWKRFIGFSFRGSWKWRARTAAAAVLGQVADERVHVLEIGAVDDEAPVLAALSQPRAREMRKVERERRRRQAELLADAPRGNAFGPGLYQKPVDPQARFL